MFSATQYTPDQPRVLPDGTLDLRDGPVFSDRELRNEPSVPVAGPKLCCPSSCTLVDGPVFSEDELRNW